MMMHVEYIIDNNSNHSTRKMSCEYCRRILTTLSITLLQCIIIETHIIKTIVAIVVMLYTIVVLSYQLSTEIVFPHRPDS